MSKLVAVVMAAGHGKRMNSGLPKVLHEVCGRPLIEYPILAALAAGAEQVVVVVNSQNRALIEECLKARFAHARISVAIQDVPRGTGDAARVGLGAVELAGEDHAMILNGDVPLIEGPRLLEMLSLLQGRALLCFLSFLAERPFGYGRVLRDDHGRVVRIREEKDLGSDAERQVQEVNGGIYVGRAHELMDALSALTADNAQSEYYVTDAIESLAQRGLVEAVVADRFELRGINDRAELNEVEAILHQRVRTRLGQAGVTIVGTPLIDHTVQVAADAHIEEGARLRGQTRVGRGSRIDVGCVLVDAVIGERVNVKPYCVVTDSVVQNDVQLGPFAHLRPGSVLESEAHVGNFVETKMAVLKRGAKANHLSYLGDVEVGERSNLGAGTIICNYDGFRKQRTVIGAEVFIGSDSQVLAPVKIGDGAYVATGTTVTEDVPKGAFAIARSRQTTKTGYAEKLRARLLAARAAERGTGNTR